MTDNIKHHYTSSDQLCGMKEVALVPNIKVNIHTPYFNRKAVPENKSC